LQKKIISQASMPLTVQLKKYGFRENALKKKRGKNAAFGVLVLRGKN